VPEDRPDNELSCGPPPADEPVQPGPAPSCLRDNVVPFRDPEEEQTNRQMKAMTAATALWVLVLFAAAAALLFAVPWAVKGIFSWFGIY
jgi:hypothetical protein